MYSCIQCISGIVADSTGAPNLGIHFRWGLPATRIFNPSLRLLFAVNSVFPTTTQSIRCPAATRRSHPPRSLPTHLLRGLHILPRLLQRGPSRSASTRSLRLPRFARLHPSQPTNSQPSRGRRAQKSSSPQRTLTLATLCSTSPRPSSVGGNEAAPPHLKHTPPQTLHNPAPSHCLYTLRPSLPSIALL